MKQNIYRKKMKLLGIALLFLIFISALGACKPPVNIHRQDISSPTIGESVVKTAQKYIGVKYRYGGNDPRGFDCSGFCNYVYRQNGYNIPRGARAQFKAGRRIPIKRAEPGDLVFFKIYGNRISHVGIYVGNYRFLHSPRRGKRVEYADMRTNYWRKRYAGTVTFFRQ